MIQSFLRGFFCFLLLVFIQSTASATHIIGGEISVVWTGDGTIYQIYMERYLNENSVKAYGLDVENTINVIIYDKATGQQLAIQPLDLKENKIITSSSNFCANTAIVNTSRQVYSGNVDLSYVNPYGTYYVTYEQCCRNESITNIVSPISQDVVFYTEFPGVATLSSSPIFRELQNEFFCRNVINTFDMSAYDKDGDRLEYSLISPQQTASPFSDVSWVYSLNGSYPIPGSMPLKIDAQTGILTFNPSQLGVFLFGIKVVEYRNNVKIGEVRKDYQFNVQNCPVNRKPEVGFKKNASIRNDTLILELRENKCFPLYITDVDASVYGLSETIYLKFNSSYPVGGLGLPATTPLYAYRDTANASVCFNPCAALNISQTTSYDAQIIINDDRCPAQYDTVNFVIRVVVPTIAIPKVFIDPPSDPKSVKVDSLLAFNVYGTGTDPTVSLSLTMYNRQSAMNFKDVADSILTISSPFTWVPTCEDLKQGNTYDIYFIIKDNSCVNRNADTVYQRILVEDNEVSFEHMNVPNLVTPNGDGKNDYYEVPGIPVGNCEHYFKGIEIYNIWGARLFYSQDRFFRWYPDVSDGVYYYSIDLNKKQKKGWVQVIR